MLSSKTPKVIQDLVPLHIVHIIFVSYKGSFQHKKLCLIDESLKLCDDHRPNGRIYPNLRSQRPEDLQGAPSDPSPNMMNPVGAPPPYLLYVLGCSVFKCCYTITKAEASAAYNTLELHARTSHPAGSTPCLALSPSAITLLLRQRHQLPSGYWSYVLAWPNSTSCRH